MAGNANENPGAGQPPESESKTIKVKFLQLWSSDRGVFLRGQVAELPKGIAASLVKELVAEKA